MTKKLEINFIAWNEIYKQQKLFHMLYNPPPPTKN
jgi:hypothetical protein